MHLDKHETNEVRIMGEPANGLEALARGDVPVLETLTQMTVNTMERSGLDPKTYILVRIAALVALDASQPSYLLNVGAAGEMGVSLEEIRGTLVAVAPVVGTAKVVSSADKILQVLGV
ncbi:MULTISPECIES: carboxymuconolactone decarboxylase family protein [unclassified Nonomuraea]|uniref:carboxymuconolactone decarboxylase family protein n=1 Tax=Nonomuraea sp. NPDC003804 TaxID=3154547 RepID=UPI0033AB6F0C